MAETNETCTCGHCFERWLSPRMRERLEYSTILRYELSKSLLDTQDSVPADVSSVLPIDYVHIDTAIHYLPPDVRASIGPSAPSASRDAPSGDTVYRGYVAVFGAIKELLHPEDEGGDGDEDKGPLKGFPSVSAVSEHLAKLRDASDASAVLISAYLDHGGKAEHALDCIVDRAREELSPLGREYGADDQYIDAILDGAEHHAECDNDLDFALVRSKLGLPAGTLGVLPEDEVDPRDPPSDDEDKD